MNMKRLSVLVAMAAVAQVLLLTPTWALEPAKVSPVAPARERVEAIVKEAYNKFKGDTRGKNADYIPALAKVDSKLFGIAIVTTDNQVLTVGDVKTPSPSNRLRRSSRSRLLWKRKGKKRSFKKLDRSPQGGPSILRWLWSICRLTRGILW